MTDKNSKDKKLQIRNSTAEFLVFTNQNRTSTIEVRYEDESIWLSQKLMAELFDVEVNTINYHLKEVYKSSEIQEHGTVRKFRIVQQEGERQVNRDIDFYNLDAIISVGYRVNSVRATQFRQWATQVLREYAIKGYVLDKKRMENGAKRRIPMTMEDWAKRLDLFLQFDERKILQNAGTISATIAKSHAESEFEKYRIIQDQLYQSDFDKLINKLGEPDDE
jgi:hypothetical protein